MQNHRALKNLLLFLGIALIAGCGTSGSNDVNSDQDADSDGPTLDDYKAQLAQIVREEIETTRKRADDTAGDVYNYKPYFYKEFHDYPEGPDAFDIAYVEQDSKTAPLAAEVRIQKLRFTTAVQRDRTAVRTDMDFQREAGIETISYELRNGHWRRVASLFIASELSTMMGGEWVPREEEPVTEEFNFEDQPGFFQRTWERMRVWDDPTETSQ